MIRRPPRSTRRPTLSRPPHFRSIEPAMIRSVNTLKYLSEAEARAIRPLRLKIVTVQAGDTAERSEGHTSELQSLMRISYAVFCLKKKKGNIKPVCNTHQNKYTITHV